MDWGTISRWRDVVEDVSRGSRVDNLERYSEKKPTSRGNDADAFVYQRRDLENLDEASLKKSHETQWCIHADYLIRVTVVHVWCG